MAKIQRYMWNYIKAEIFFLACLFASVWAYVYYFASPPNLLVSFQYSKLALDPVANGELLFRWAHIYLQRPFLLIARNPVAGIHLYVGFLLASTTVLVYYCARNLKKDGSSIHGIAAVILFLSTDLWLSSNENFPDFTLLLFVVLAVAIFLKWQSQPNREKNFLLMGLGFCMFAAMRSKETGAAVLILALGLANGPQYKFEIQKFAGRLAWLLSGVLIGLGLGAILDHIFLNDALFLLRGMTYEQYSLKVFNTSDLISGAKTAVYSWFALFEQYIVNEGRQWIIHLMYNQAPLVFLSIISAIQLFRQGSSGGKLVVWLVPLGVLLILILGSVPAGGPHIEVMQGILAFTAVQFIQVEKGKEKHLLTQKNYGPVWQWRIWALVLALAAFGMIRYSGSLPDMFKGLVVLPAILVLFWEAINSNRPQGTNLLAVTLAFLVFGAYFALYQNVISQIIR